MYGLLLRSKQSVVREMWPQQHVQLGVVAAGVYGPIHLYDPRPDAPTRLIPPLQSTLNKKKQPARGGGASTEKMLSSANCYMSKHGGAAETAERNTRARRMTLLARTSPSPRHTRVGRTVSCVYAYTQLCVSPIYTSPLATAGEPSKGPACVQHWWGMRSAT